MAFWRKKKEKPKSTLGYALFRFDKIFNGNPRGLFLSIKQGKKINLKRLENIIISNRSEFNKIADDISVENFKTDYRSDKIRYSIIDMIDETKNYLLYLKNNKDNSYSQDNSHAKTFDKIVEIRENIKKRMKDIEGDYV